MKAFSKLLLGVLAIVVLGGCSLGFKSFRGSGTLVNVGSSEVGFTGLELSHGCKATVERGEGYSVEVRVDDNLTDLLKVERKGAILVIRLEPFHGYREVTLQADITMPDIESLRLSGGSDCHLTGFDLDHHFSGQLSGGSELTGDLSSRDVTLSLSGGSQANIKGTSSAARLHGSGGSVFKLGEFTGGDVDVDLSGGSTIAVAVEDTLTGNMSGGSQVRYTGDPTIGKISKSGGSRVVKR